MGCSTDAAITYRRNKLAVDPSNHPQRSDFTPIFLISRATDRILKVSRTIADLQESVNIQVSHLAEAIQYRTIDRMQ